MFDPLIIALTCINPLFEEYPQGIRNYEIRDWTGYGKSELISVETFQSRENPEFLPPCKKVPAVGLAIATKDFNLKSMDKEIKATSEVYFLPFMKSEIIIVTAFANQEGWMEGYKPRTSKCTVGLFHTAFIKLLY